MTSSLHLLYLLFLSSSLLIQARESHFFSKTSRFGTSTSDATTTTPAAEEPAMVFSPQSQNGYGLYGDVGDQSLPTNYKNDNAGLYGDVGDQSPPTNYKDNQQLPSKSYDTYDTNTIPSTLSNEFNSHGGYESKKPNNPYYSNEYGMSDTRTLDDGKYYYNVDAEEKGNSGGYGSTHKYEFNRRGENYGNEGYGYQRNGNRMNEYQSNQEEYVP